MKDENGYYGRRLRQAYEEGRKDGIIYMTGVMFALWFVVWLVMQFG